MPLTGKQSKVMSLMAIVVVLQFQNSLPRFYFVPVADKAEALPCACSSLPVPPLPRRAPF